MGSVFLVCSEELHRTNYSTADVKELEGTVWNTLFL